MEISDSRNEVSHDWIDTPDGSLFIPSPTSSLIHLKESAAETLQSAKDMRLVPSSEPQYPQEKLLQAIVGSEHPIYSGLNLERFTIHQGRFGSLEDSSLLEAIVQSSYDEFKSVRVVAEGSESVHSFMSALSDEFLNSSTCVHLRQVTVLSPDKQHYVCLVEAVYPAVPRFMHLAKVYLGAAVSDRSVLHASLSAACNAVGQILLTFQPEGYVIPERRPETPVRKSPVASPLPSTIDSPVDERSESDDVPSSFLEPTMEVNTVNRTEKRSSFSFRKLFACGRSK